jgi:hypothetical protein
MKKMITYNLEMQFGQKGYIGDPYWPEREKFINIQKQSGMNRARSTANRRKALEEHLGAIGMSLADYEALEKLAKRPFYTESGEIIIPELHVMSFLVATCDEARAATRPCEPNQVRSRFIVTPWTTGKTESDGVFSRFVTPGGGGGGNKQKLSNQRGLRENDYISNFTAKGLITFDPDFVDAKTLQRGIEWGGTFVGIGACRKMGYGRFQLKVFAELRNTKRVAA